MKINVLAALPLCLFIAACNSNANTNDISAISSSMNIKADSSQQFADRITSSKIPVVVDFWAGWCMPCKYLDPIIAELEKEYKGRILFMKVDVDIHKAISAYFKVNAIPSVFVIEDKTVRTALNGVRTKEAYKEAIESALKLAADRKAGAAAQPAPSEKK
jgi:thioredoxin